MAAGFALAPCLAAGTGAAEPVMDQAVPQTVHPRQFRVWAAGCCHVGTDWRVGRRESLAEAIRHSEDPQFGFDWDIALLLGDFSGTQLPPGDAEGREVVRQFAALARHRREQVYCLVGNHDASGPDEPCQWWFRKWLDPTGENTASSGVDPQRRPFPVEGTWERYAFGVGNLRFLMMGDRNDGEPPVGRGPKGGYPAGAVTDETFAWWQAQVEQHPDAVMVAAHHHMLRETTVASGPWEGYERTADGGWKPRYHGYFADGGPAGASYLYFVGGRPDAGAFEGYLAQHPGAIDLWLGGHTHTHPDDRTGARSHIEHRWGVWFANVAALTRYHGRPHSVPMSRLFTFTDGSDEVRVQCFLHSSDYAPLGWYAPAERTLKLTKPVRL